jgi:hypothetical protein
VKGIESKVRKAVKKSERHNIFKFIFNLPVVSSVEILLFVFNWNCMKVRAL